MDKGEMFLNGQTPLKNPKPEPLPSTFGLHQEVFDSDKMQESFKTEVKTETDVEVVAKQQPSSVPVLYRLVKMSKNARRKARREKRHRNVRTLGEVAGADILGPKQQKIWRRGMQQLKLPRGAMNTLRSLVGPMPKGRAVNYFGFHGLTWSTKAIQQLTEEHLHALRNISIAAAPIMERRKKRRLAAKERKLEKNALHKAMKESARHRFTPRIQPRPAEGEMFFNGQPPLEDSDFEPVPSTSGVQQELFGSDQMHESFKTEASSDDGLKKEEEGELMAYEEQPDNGDVDLTTSKPQQKRLTITREAMKALRERCGLKLTKKKAMQFFASRGLMGSVTPQVVSQLTEEQMQPLRDFALNLALGYERRRMKGLWKLENPSPRTRELLPRAAKEKVDPKMQQLNPRADLHLQKFSPWLPIAIETANPNMPSCSRSMPLRPMDPTTSSFQNADSEHLNDSVVCETSMLPIKEEIKQEIKEESDVVNWSA